MLSYKAHILRSTRLQWAAVTIYLELINEPPHIDLYPVGIVRSTKTIQGYWSIAVFIPPYILSSPALLPHMFSAGNKLLGSQTIWQQTLYCCSPSHVEFLIKSFTFGESGLGPSINFFKCSQLSIPIHLPSFPSGVRQS